MSNGVKTLLGIALVAILGWFLFFRGRISKSGTVATPHEGGAPWWQTTLGRLAGSRQVQDQVGRGLGRLFNLDGTSNMPAVPADTNQGHPDWLVVPESDYGAGD